MTKTMRAVVLACATAALVAAPLASALAPTATSAHCDFEPTANNADADLAGHMTFDVDGSWLRARGPPAPFPCPPSRSP